MDERDVNERDGSPSKGVSANSCHVCTFHSLPFSHVSYIAHHTYVYMYSQLTNYTKDTTTTPIPAGLHAQTLTMPTVHTISSK